MHTSLILFRGTGLLVAALAAALAGRVVLNSVGLLDGVVHEQEQSRLVRADRLEAIVNEMSAAPLSGVEEKRRQDWRSRLGELRDSPTNLVLGRRSRLGSLASRLNFAIGAGSRDSARANPAPLLAEALAVTAAEKRAAADLIAAAKDAGVREKIVMLCVFLGVFGMASRGAFSRPSSALPVAEGNAAEASSAGRIFGTPRREHSLGGVAAMSVR